MQLTKNGKAHSFDGLSANISTDRYVEYASFLAKVISHFNDNLSISFDYVSPFNEPQWEWKGGQEGSPWNNKELAQMTRVLDSVFVDGHIDSKIEITEAGQIDYLTGKKEKYTNRSDQIEQFFNPQSPDYLGGLISVAPKIVAHSYFTTWDVSKLRRERERIAAKLQKYPSLEYWMSEYCILENNEEIRGKGKDLGMQTALYVARVIHADLTIANASAWHWWLAISPYDFKDGLIYVDKDTINGHFSDSKLLWAFGNYSRFIRPGAKRIKVGYKLLKDVDTLKEGILISAYKNTDASIVIVAVNRQEKAVELMLNGPDFTNFSVKRYVTDDMHDLSRLPGYLVGNRSIGLSERSITTLVLEPKK